MTATAPWLSPLAEWCASLDGAALSAPVRDRVRDAAIDWWGALAAGVVHPLSARYGRPLRDGAGEASAAGDPSRRPISRGAAFNAAGVAHRRLDDGHRLAIMHPGVR
jgi:2-methylcitrate dehydratase PrpD